MKKQLLTLGLLATLGSSVYGYTYNVKDGIQQIHSVAKVKDMNVFKNSCVNFLWSNGHKATKNPHMKLYAADNIDYHYLGNKLITLDSEDIFWIKANGGCNLEIDDDTVKVYEDAEGDNTDQWEVYYPRPSTATITIERDEDRQSNVINLSGDGTNDRYRIGHNIATSPRAWNDTEHKTIRWSMNFSEVYYMHVAVETTKGSRMMQYSSGITDKGIVGTNKNYVHHGLGTDSRNGTWQTVTRDLEADLKEFDPDNSITSVNSLLISGSGKLDNIMLIGENDN